MNHDAIDELLVGYVLRTLSGDDAAQADRLLSEHVPSCAACRAALDAFQGVAADLTLAADPLAPPEVLLPRLHRELEPRSRRWGGNRGGAVAAGVVAAVIGLAGVGGFAIGQGRTPADSNDADIARAVEFAKENDATLSSVGQVTEIAAPGVEEFYITGTNVPAPPPGMTYRLWLIEGTSAQHLYDFRPSASGTVVVHGLVDPTHADGLLVTVEPAGSIPTAPGQPMWSSAA